MQRGGNFLHNPLPFSTGGQTLNDRLNSAKFTIAGSQIGKVVCKATTEEFIGPKKKHLDYLLHCTHEPNVNIPYLANLLIERTHSEHWAVVFKSLITMHNLMCYGNERFMQYLASCNARMDVTDFIDRSSAAGLDMSTHVRQYGKYITEKTNAYRKMAYDFCKLLKTIPVLQNQIVALLEFKVRSDDLTNGVINSAFILMFRDMIRLFACYNDGIINLLEKYFEMNKKQCREALTLYKAFVSRMDGVSEFLKVAESVGIDKGDIPDLSRAPSSLMDALEGHLCALEGGKVPPVAPVVAAAAFANDSANVAPQRFAAEGGEQRWGRGDSLNLDDDTKRRYLEEEARYLEMLKARSKAADDTAANVAAHIPESLESSAWTPSGSTTSSSSAAPSQQNASAIDDLLGLSDDWAANSGSRPATATGGQFEMAGAADQAYNPFAAMLSQNQQVQQGNQSWAAPQSQSSQQQFDGYPNGGTTGTGFAADFGNAFNQPSGVSLGSAMQPQRSAMSGSAQPPSPSNAASQPKTTANGKLLTSDLDTSLMSLVQNLDMKDKNQRAHLSPSASHGRSGGPMAQSTVPAPVAPTPNYYGGWGAAGPAPQHNPNPMMQPYWPQHSGSAMGAQPFAAQPMNPFPPQTWQTAAPATGAAQQPFF